MVSIWKDMIKVGDIYCNRDKVMVRVDKITYRYLASLGTLTYLELFKVKTSDLMWYGYWESEWFLQHFRPVSKLEKLLAGL